MRASHVFTAAALAAFALTLLTASPAIAQNPHLRETPSPAYASAARFSALWLPDATVTVLVALKTDRADAAAFRAIYRIDCATNEALSIAYEAFDAEGASLGAVSGPPEGLAASFERLSWERPCPRNDIPTGFAVDPSPPPLFDSLRFPLGGAQSMAEAITFTREREATYARARQISSSGQWRRVEDLPTEGATYVQRSDAHGGYRRIDLLFVPDTPSSDGDFALVPFAYERIVYSVACQRGRARVLYRLRATAEHQLAAYQDEGPEVPYTSLLHRDALVRACANARGAEINALSDVLRDAHAH